ncbi:MAG: hypothetical protein ACRD4K_06125 [Candidatus Acidiferrales bacterium]
MRLFKKVLIGLVAAYLILSAALLAVMYQPPDRFGRIMARVPWPFFVVLPFQPLWYVARGGHVSVGDRAPDFSLPTYDHKSHVELASFRGQKPVVLVFGSYT